MVTMSVLVTIPENETDDENRFEMVSNQGGLMDRWMSQTTSGSVVVLTFAHIAEGDCANGK